MPSLPPELIPLILAEFPEDSEFLRQCALVCRSWAYVSRPISFRTLKVTGNHLYTVHRASRTFIQLCASPFETFSKSNVHTLEFCEWPRYVDDPAGQHLVMNELLEWRSFDGTKTFSSLFPVTKRLSFMGNISWKSLSRVASKVLHEEFRTVTELRLEYICIGVEDFLSLTHSFPSLQSLELRFLRQISTTVSETYTPVIERPHPTLERIILDNVANVDFIKSLHGAPHLKVLHLEGLTLFRHLVESHELQLCITQLMHSARSTLEEFRSRFYFENPTEIDNFLAWLDLTKLCKLRRIDLDFDLFTEDPAFPLSFCDFFDKLSTSSDTVSSNLEVLSIPSLPKHIQCMDFQNFDEILQRPYFSSLRELKCTFTCDFTRKDAAKQIKHGGRQYFRPDEDSAAELDLRERIRDFKATYLPKCEARGIIFVTDTTYYYCNLPPKLWVKVASAARRAVRKIRSRTSGAVGLVADTVRRLVRLG
uniref:Uncharacterized protein n=1 Tax=Moniliophthora roreri TaxID=221103 RepID=A0A0W0G6W6_MONRR